MRIAAQVAAKALIYLEQFLQPQITTKELDQKADAFIRSYGCSSAFFNYKNYPANICISINDEAVHCIPNNRKLQNGDVVKIDLGAIYEGFYSDTAATYIVGQVSDSVKRFVDTGYKALKQGITQALPGNHISDIGNAVASFVAIHKYGVVAQFVGHGIGKQLHEEPQIPNVFLSQKGPELCANMVICIEPIITMNPKAIVKSEGAWNTKTTDESLVAHWEHTILITEKGPEVLTLREGETL